MRTWQIPASASLAAILALAAPGARGGVADLRVDRVGWEETVSVQEDGRLEPGESGRIRVQIVNTGSAPVGPVSGVLVASETVPGLTVTSAITGWGALASHGEPGDSAGDSGSLSIAFDASAACEGPLRFDLELTAGGEPPISLPLSLPVGQVSPTLVPPTDIGFQVGLSYHLAWNGSHYGAAWNTGPFLRPAFVRLGPEGELMDWPPLDLSASAPQWGPLAMAAGGERWAVARLKTGPVLSVAVIGSNGTLLCDVDVWAAEEAPSFTGPPAMAWDGTHWAIWWVSAKRTAEGWDFRRLLFCRVSADGVPELPVKEIWVPTVLNETFTYPLAWNGDEFVGIAATELGDWLVQIDRNGSHRVQALPYDSQSDLRLCLAISDTGMALADPAAGRIVGFTRDGELDWGPVPIVPDRLEDGIDSYDHCSLAWNGEDYGLATVFSKQLPFEPWNQQWITFLSLSRDGRSFAPRIELEPWQFRGDCSSLGSRGAAWNPQRREWAIPATWTDDPPQAGMGIGYVSLQRFAADRTCPAEDVPREVSGPASGVPLLASLEIFEPCVNCPDEEMVVLHVEDLGAEALTYNSYVFALYRGRWMPGGFPFDVDCGMVPTPGGQVSPEGGGRLRVEAQHEPPDLRNFVRVTGYLVSASNEWGSGPWGRGTFGPTLAPRDACHASP